MTTIHTFKTAQGTEETRTSKTRAYQACLVATVTEATRTYYQGKIQEALDKAAELEAKLVAMEAERGMTLAQARAKQDEEMAVRDWFSTLWAEKKAMAVEHGYKTTDSSLIKESEAVARLASKGILNPWREEGPHGLVCLAECACYQRDTAKGYEKDLEAAVVGNEQVVSWHLSVNNAVKALGQPGPFVPKKNRWGIPTRPSDADMFRTKGCTVAIRTDFEVRETKPRTAKVA